MNDYLRDRAMRRSRGGDSARGRGRGRDYARGELYRNDYANDMRNPYGARGGYVRDLRMDDPWRRPYNEQDYQETKYHGVQPIGYEERDNEDMERGRSRGRDNARGGRRDYRSDYNDYGNDYQSDYNDYAMDYAKEDEEWKKHLKKWSEKLKKKDRFKLPMEQVIRDAKNMGVEFEEFDEMEFYVTYLMMVSDYPKIANNYQSYLSMAKDWLEDDDVEMMGSDKLCAYYYEIVKGGE